MWLGCSTTKRLRSNEVLLKKVIIKCENPKVSKEEIYGYLKQKPNRKLFGTNIPHLLKRGKIGRKNLLVNGAGYPFYLHIYNLVSPTRDFKRQQKHQARFEKRKLKYLTHPKTKKGRPKRAPSYHKTVGQFFYTIGEPPVILDSSKTSRSVHQVGLYLDNKGYFHSTVKDTLIYPWLQRNKKKKAILCFIVEPAQPYTIRKINWDIRDPNIAYDLQTDTAAAYCLLKQGSNYDVDTFELERDRITKSLRNNGYYLFSKDYIRFTVDTGLGTHQLDVNIIINKQRIKTSDSTSVEVNHQRFYVRNIIIKSISNLQQLREDTMVYDTTVFHEMIFLRNTESLAGIPIESKLRYKPEVLSSRISFRGNILYRQNDYEATYEQLTDLRVFKQVVIDPVIVSSDKIDVVVKLLPIAKQNFTTQIEGTTNSGSNLGIGGSFGYQNNNIFRGAEIFNISIKGGTEVQQTISGNTNTSPTSGLAFNTIQFGSEASMNIPREFFPFSLLVKKNRPEEKRITQERRTVFIASFNYQKRIDYDRSLANLSYGYTFRIRKLQTATRPERDRGKISFFPIELNVVKVTPHQGLLDLLQNPDPLLHYRFTDHLIRDFRITYVYNSQERAQEQKKRNVVFLKIDAESAGLLLYPEFKYILHAQQDASGSYRIAGIPFSEYVRFFFDVRDYKSIGDHERLVNRLAIGVGIPLKNFPTLPLEKSFYGGGANGIRAWEARSLGPGSYIIPSDQKYAQFGDIQIEYNIEMRFRITKALNGAVFMDGGNVWLLKADPLRPNADFKFDKFYNDLAFGPGVGLRYDLSFFIVRLDLAFKLRDPGQPYGERWWIPGQRNLGSNLNFGIGYPF